MMTNKDPMGRAVADFHQSGRASRLRVFSPMFDEDEIPVEVLFRSPDEMPDLEREALRLAHGEILDVGAGAGCHSLALQQSGKSVTAVDISPLCVATMRERGVLNVQERDFFTMKGKFDTVLMLMNGIGIVGTLSHMDEFFMQVDALLNDGGQVLCDSSDLCYLYEDEDGIIDLTGVEGYYGELIYRMQYKEIKGESFPWLFIDPETLRDHAARCGFGCEIVACGPHYDYLARLTRR